MLLCTSDSLRSLSADPNAVVSQACASFAICRPCTARAEWRSIPAVHDHGATGEGKGDYNFTMFVCGGYQHPIITYPLAELSFRRRAQINLRGEATCEAA